MSGLGLLATAFGSYASTLGGLYKEQVEKEQAAQEKLAAEERLRAWEREKTAGERQFTIELLQRKFDYDVKLKSMENEWEARKADIAHQRALERMGYASKLLGGRPEVDPEKAKLVVDALTKQLSTLSKMIENARPEERQTWIDKYQATQQTLNNYLGLGNAGGTLFRDPEVIVNSLANE